MSEPLKPGEFEILQRRGLGYLLNGVLLLFGLIALHRASESDSAAFAGVALGCFSLVSLNVIAQRLYEMLQRWPEE